MSILIRVKPRILLTGSSGFIAGGIKFNNDEIVDRIDIKDGIDICTYKAKENYDIIIHTAALISVTESGMYPFTYFDTNVVGTKNLIQQHPKAHFIFLSTASVYGEGEDHTVNSLIRPLSIYSWTKAMAESVIFNLCPSYCVLRLTNVIGDGGHLNVYEVFKTAKEIHIYGDGSQTRDFIDVKNVREIILACFDRRGIYNVGSGISKSILEVAKEFNKPIKYYPARENEIKHFGIADAFNLNSVR